MSNSFLRSLDVFHTTNTFTLGKRTFYSTVCARIVMVIAFLLLAGFTLVMILEPLKLDRTGTRTEQFHSCLETQSNERRRLAMDTGTVQPSPVTSSSLTFTESTKFRSKLKRNNFYLAEPDLFNVYHPFNETGVNFAYKPNDISTDPKQVRFFAVIYDYPQNYTEVVDLVNCTLAMFPSEVADELTAIGITDYLCFPDISELPIYGNFGRSPHILYVAFSVFRCYDECDELDEDLANGAYFDLLWTDKIFDSQSQIAKTRVMHDLRVYIDAVDMAQTEITIVPNKVSYQNGTEELFYTLQKKIHTFAWGEGRKLWLTAPLMMEDYYYVHEEYSIWQPDFSRRLETTSQDNVNEIKETKELEIVAFIFYILANLGGLYIFIFLAAGFCIRGVTDRVISHHAMRATSFVFKKKFEEFEADKNKQREKVESSAKNAAAKNHSKSLPRISSPPFNPNQSFKANQPLIGPGADMIDNQYEGGLEEEKKQKSKSYVNNLSMKIQDASVSVSNSGFKGSQPNITISPPSPLTKPRPPLTTITPPAYLTTSIPKTAPKWSLFCPCRRKSGYGSLVNEFNEARDLAQVVAKVEGLQERMIRVGQVQQNIDRLDEMVEVREKGYVPSGGQVDAEYARMMQQQENKDKGPKKSKVGKEHKENVRSIHQIVNDQIQNLQQEIISGLRR